MKISLHGTCKLELYAQLVFALVLGASGATLKRSVPASSFLELHADTSSEAVAKNGPLFPVAVNFDWKNHDPTEGVTIKMSTDSGSLRMIAGVDASSDSISWGYMKDDLSKDGWIKLYLQTSDSTLVTNDVKMYAAGFIEGMLTAVRMSQFYSNFYQTMVKDESVAQALAAVKRMFKQELEFVTQNSNWHAGVISVEPADPYWKHMRYQFVQLWAVKDGYNFVAMGKGKAQIDLIDMLVINSHAELPELIQAYTPEAIQRRKQFQKAPVSLVQGLRGASPKAKNKTVQEVDRDWEERLIKRGHCSALVRLAPENKDLLIGHTTWGDYAKMTRIFKYYHFNLPGAYTKANVIGFSSYPGCISSTDDFYILDSGLAVMDTSLEILNTDAYNRVADFPANSKVPDFMNVMVANRMASTAAHWASLFSEKNSGTDNAQWMIVDYNRFTPGQALRDGTLFVIEKIPGVLFKKDMTPWLRDKGYWASYNRPYFPKVREMSGHTQAEAQYGALYSWGESPRASIFKSVAPLAEHLMDMRQVMNRNMWPAEGVLPSEPGHAISGRMDLGFSKIPNGGIDAKVANRCLFRSLQCQAISGPSHVKQPVFMWKQGVAEMMPGWPHLGLPDAYNFDWVQMSPTAQLKAVVDIDQC